MDYKVYDYKITIFDCFKYNRNEQVAVLLDAKEKYPNSRIWERSMYSMLCEWRVHKLCYKLGLYKSHTKDADIEYPIDPKMEKVYKFIGFFL